MSRGGYHFPLYGYTFSVISEKIRRTAVGIPVDIITPSGARPLVAIRLISGSFWDPQSSPPTANWRARCRLAVPGPAVVVPQRVKMVSKLPLRRGHSKRAIYPQSFPGRNPSYRTGGPSNARAGSGAGRLSLRPFGGQPPLRSELSPKDAMPLRR